MYGSEIISLSPKRIVHFAYEFVCLMVLVKGVRLKNDRDPLNLLS